MSKNKYGEMRPWLSLATVMAGVFAVSMALSYLVAFLFGGLAANLAESGNETAILLVNMAILIVMYAAQCAVIYFCMRYFFHRGWKDMGLVRKEVVPQTLLGVAFGAVSIVVAALLLVLSGNAVVAQVDTGYLLSLSFWMGMVQYIFVAVFEELLCRGYMMTALKTTRNRLLIITAPAVLFGLLHITNANVTAFSIINTVLVGILFGYLFVKTGRLWAPIGYHFAWNFVQGDVLGIAVSGGTSHGVVNIAFTGPDWFTGGAYGIEGGAACTLAILLGLVFIYYFVKTPREESLWTPESGMPMPFGPQPSQPEA